MVIRRTWLEACTQLTANRLHSIPWAHSAIERATRPMLWRRTTARCCQWQLQQEQLAQLDHTAQILLRRLIHRRGCWYRFVSKWKLDDVTVLIRAYKIDDLFVKEWLYLKHIMLWCKSHCHNSPTHDSLPRVTTMSTAILVCRSLFVAKSSGSKVRGSNHFNAQHSTNLLNPPLEWYGQYCEYEHVWTLFLA